jgi:hypothetical protein
LPDVPLNYDLRLQGVSFFSRIMVVSEKC